MTRHWTTTGAVALALIVLASAASAQQSRPRTARICLAPASAQMASGNNAEAVDAVRESFTAYLTGPTLGVASLTARLASQAREEARLAGCGYVLFTTLKHARKEGGGGFLGRLAGSAVESGAREMTGVAHSATVRVAAGAAAGAAASAARNMANDVKQRDELTLEYRLEGADGGVLVKGGGKRRAKSDGEDLLTPLVEEAAEKIAGAASGRSR